MLLYCVGRGTIYTCVLVSGCACVGCLHVDVHVKERERDKEDHEYKHRTREGRRKEKRKRDKSQWIQSKAQQESEKFDLRCKRVGPVLVMIGRSVCSFLCSCSDVPTLPSCFIVCSLPNNLYPFYWSLSIRLSIATLAIQQS